jgi:hypothetical protein
MDTRTNIPLYLRVGPIQVLAIAIFAIGGVLGMIAANGAVLIEQGQFTVGRPVLAATIAMAIAAFLMFVSALVKPAKIHLEYHPYNRALGRAVAAIYMAAGFALLVYNWQRLDVSDLLLVKPGSIAYQLTEQHGAVIYYTTMLCFFVGASFMLEVAQSKLLRNFVVLSIVAFAVGVLAISRREMLLLVFAWGFVHALTRRKISATVVVILAIPCLIAIFVTTIVFRGIDVVEEPTAYFLSGEFEPFRFALYLIDNWVREGGVYYSPWSYAIPYVDPAVLAESTNCQLVFDFLHNDCLGSYTITVFASFLYFGFAFPLFFYVVTVWLAKQSGYWLSMRGGPFSSFIYAFFLLKVILFIRNGELFDSLIDSITLIVLLIIFFFVTGWKVYRRRDASPIVR